MSYREKIFTLSMLTGSLLLSGVFISRWRLQSMLPGTTPVQPTPVATFTPVCHLPTPTLPLPTVSPTLPFQIDASTSWCWQEVMGLINSLNDVFFWDTRTGWAVGERGTILHTGDGGSTWQRQTSPAIANLYRVTFVDAQTGWIVGGPHWTGARKNVLLHTDDGGRTWRELPLPSNAAWENTDITWPNAQRGWLIMGPYVFRSSDGGQTWQEQLIPATESHLEAITSVDSQHAWIVAGDTILRTTDAGATWTAHTFGIELALSMPPFNRKTVAFTTPLVGWVTDSGGVILNTADGGQTWQAQREKYGYGTQDIAFLDASTGWIGKGNTLWHTTDGGATWEKGVMPYSRRAITFVDAQHGWAVGALSGYGDQRVTIAHTNDGGETWHIQDSHIKIPAPTYANAVHLTAYLAQQDPPLEALLAHLLRSPCVLGGWKWMEAVLGNLGWDGANWGTPLPMPDSSLLQAVRQLEADLDKDGTDEIVLSGHIASLPTMLLQAVLDWDGTQWQVAWHNQTPLYPHGGEIQARVDDFNADGQLELSVEGTFCGHTGCSRSASLVRCEHLSCRSIWQKELGGVMGGAYQDTLYDGWSSSDYRFVDLEGDSSFEIELQRYGLSYKIAADETWRELPETLEAQVLTTTQTIYRWDGTYYTPTAKTVLEPGYMLDTQPVSRTVDLDGDGIMEQVTYHWETDRWRLQQVLSIYARDDQGVWQPVQALTATVVDPSAGISLKDLDGDGQFEVVRCTDPIPASITLDTWPSRGQSSYTIYNWDTRTRSFEPYVTIQHWKMRDSVKVHERISSPPPPDSSRKICLECQKLPVYGPNPPKRNCDE